MKRAQKDLRLTGDARQGETPGAQPQHDTAKAAGVKESSSRMRTCSASGRREDEIQIVGLLSGNAQHHLRAAIEVNALVARYQDAAIGGVGEFIGELQAGNADHSSGGGTQ